jgi:hypothetical protein
MVLYGPVPDQAALGGLLDRILSSGLVGLLSEAGSPMTVVSLPGRRAGLE